MQPKVSVIIPVYNQETYLAETINSVLAQSYAFFELILVNDGSQDRTAEIINDYARRDKRIIAIHTSNSGKPAAINTGVTRAQGEIIAFMDHDDLMIPDRLEKQVAYLQTNPEVSAVSSHCYYIDDKGDTIGIQRYQNLRTPDEGKKSIRRKEIIMCAFTALTITKAAFLDIDGLRPRFWPSDDIDFINRLAENGLLVVIMQDILVKYRIHARSTTSSQQWQMFRMADYTNYSIRLRNENKPEISFEAFLELRKNEGWYVNFRRNTHNYSILFLQKANFMLAKGKFGKFAIRIAQAFFLDPYYVAANVRKRLILNRERQ